MILLNKPKLIFMRPKKQVLIVSRHQAGFSCTERSLFEKVYGKCILTFIPKRFTSVEELFIFHDEQLKNYDFIYYTLPKRYKAALKSSGRSFGVVLHPTKRRRTIEFTIEHHIPIYAQEIIVAQKKIARKCGQKGYKNIPGNIRKNKKVA